MKIIATVNTTCDHCKEPCKCYAIEPNIHLCQDCYDIEREKLNK